MALLEIENLSISFDTLRGTLKAVDGISFSVNEGETLGIVGESGCGKSITSLSVMKLLPPNARVTATRLQFADQDLLKTSERKMRKIRGGDIGMIFQDPLTSLNPSFTVGFQLVEVLREHVGGNSADLIKKAEKLLEHVGIPDATSRLNSYPHELSGGMCQRVMISMAIASRPRLLIADEPTTALDVTIQAQILHLLLQLQKEYGMALILITHDIGVVAQMADRILVMYGGQIFESGKTSDVIQTPKHPYTEGLLRCLPGMHDEKEHKSQLPSIPGLVPDLVNRPSGCILHPRCQYATEECEKVEPENRTINGRFIKCHTPVGEQP